MALLE